MMYLGNKAASAIYLGELLVCTGTVGARNFDNVLDRYVINYDINTLTIKDS